MDCMDVDSPPDPGPLRPRDRVIRRLAQFGVPEEYLQKQHEGLVAFVGNNNGVSIQELVSVILPPDEEVVTAFNESKSGPKKAVTPSLKNRFRECMVWLQWLMFLGDPGLALKRLASMSSGRGVCGSVWGNNDIAYRCRTCEHDPTCAICVPCFKNGNHKDHDYSIIYTGGGCCDCGDVTAWKREGFCSKHKGAEQIQPLPPDYASSVGPVLDVLLGLWKDKLAGAESSKGTDRSSAMKKVANELTFVVIEMLLEFCKQSESLLSFVSKRIMSLFGLLEMLVRAERFLSEGVARKLSELLLKLLGEPVFKYEFAKVFLGYYPVVVSESVKEGSDEAFKKFSLLSTFSVQIFTVPTLTPRLVKEMNLLAVLLGCLGDIFVHCSGDDGLIQVSKWGNLYETTIRVVEDIRFVMSHSVVPKYVTNEQRDILKTWLKLLSFMQGMSPLKRETGLHIEEENEHINLPFVLGHSIASIHSLLVDGVFSASDEAEDNISSGFYKQDSDEGVSIRHAKVGRLSQESSVCSVSGRDNSIAETRSNSTHHLPIPSSVTWLTHECLKAIENSLGAESMSSLAPNTSIISTGNFLGFRRTLSRIRKGKSIFGALTSSSEEHDSQFLSHSHGSSRSSDMDGAKSMLLDRRAMISGDTDSGGPNDILVGGDSSTELEALRVLSLCDWPQINYDVSSQEVSIHIPLHRLLSLILQRAMKKFYSESMLWDVTSASTSNPAAASFDYFFRPLLGGCQPHGFSAFIMEHPLRNRVFFAEVQALMWRKNGDAAVLYCEWYRSVRWAEQGLENDLYLLQCCAALAPPDLFVTRMIERFGLLDYLSLNPEQSSEFEPVLVQEMLKLIIQIVQERRFSGLSPAENLRRELIHKLATGDSTRSQLVKSLPRDISKFDKLQEILDSVAVYLNPSGFNQGMYALRWSCWKELDLYNPRWNSRDLQVAEERYMRYCNVSALTTQMPRWTKIYPPLKCVAGVATCKAVLQIIRAVLFYAVYTYKSTETRAPDGVLLSALHLLSLAFDICFQQRDSANLPSHVGDAIPLIAFAVEEIREGLHYMANGCSLLTLLVSLMRLRKRADNFLEAGSCNLSSLIESLLKKFAELDAGCMIKLQQLPPEVVMHVSQLMSNNDTTTSGSSSDSEKRKAKARERQAAILAKMKAEQSKFLSSINNNVTDSKSELEESNFEEGGDVKETPEVVCSLCHDPNSKNPLSFLILLQKSRLLSFIDRGPLSWDQVRQTDPDQMSASSNNAGDPSIMITSPGGLAVADKSGIHSSSGGLGVISSSQMAQIVQDAINDFAGYAQPGEVDAIMDFVKVELPSLKSTHVSTSSVDLDDFTASTFEKFEQDMFKSIWEELHSHMLLSSDRLGKKNLDLASAKIYSKTAASAVLGKYIAALSRERTGNLENLHNDKTQVESTSSLSMSNRFSPTDCDGIHLSSCGHAVHQECLDRYLSSLKERFIRRIVFEGGHIVDPDQGEFLCPVCRRLANSVLPSLPGDYQRVWKQPLIPKIVPSIAADPLAASSGEGNSLCLRQAFSLLQSAANMVGKGENLKTFPHQRNERMMSNLDPIYRVLSKLYFPNRQDKFTGSARLNHSMIMWDTLKYSIVSMEIAARCGRSSMNPTYGLNILHKELKSSSGFTLSLLLKTVHSLRRKNSLHVLQRFRGIQLFANSICSGLSEGHVGSPYGGGGMSCILKHADKEVPFPDTQFWNQAASPIIAHDAFSSFMWVLYCLPYPFLSCAESLLCLVHIFYVVSVTQAIIAYYEKHHSEGSSGLQECLITDISKVLVGSEWIKQNFRSNYVDFSADIKDIIRKSTFPYLRRCALMWRLLSTSMSVPFCDRDHRDHEFGGQSHAINDMMDYKASDLAEVNEVQELEKMFKIPQLDNILEDKELRSVVRRWLDHFLKDEVYSFQHSLHIVPAVPFKLMRLPHLYQDLLQRYIKQRCADCKNVLEEPALCLLCGKLCSPNWKPCCRDSGCQSHALTCGAGTGVFLLIRRTTILLQRCARQAPWPSPYLDAFGEEDIEMYRGKPLYLNEERYAALSYLVASHGLDQSSKVLGQTTIGTFFLV